MSQPNAGFADKVVVVTGGSRGLGRAMAVGFAREGADVVIASRNVERCQDVAAEIEALGRRALPVACHVGRWDDGERLIDETVAEFGRIDVLINNAGIAPVAPSISDISEELFDKTVDVNLKGPVRLTGLAALHMAPGSTIINISSKASTSNTPLTAVYGAAKAGLNSFTRAAALELGPKGIRVNAIVCGTFMTDSLAKNLPTDDARAALASKISLGRIAEADEIVGTALWMAGDASSYLNGQSVTLDGGGG